MRGKLAKIAAVALAGSLLFPAAPRAAERENGRSAQELTLADLMSIMQSRHLKLGYAALAKNWPLADYETRLMQQSFTEAARQYPNVGNLPLADLVKTTSTPALDEIAQAVEERDQTTFFVAFKKLTSACNSCHVTSRVGFIVIEPPTSSPFSNQNFEPASK